VEYLKESEASTHHRRRRQRTARTLTVIALLMLGSFAYAAAYYQGWVGNSASPQPLASRDCQSADRSRSLSPEEVTINVYNATDRAGLAASVAKSLRTLGFTVAKVANDPKGRSMAGVGEVRHGPTATAGATLVGARLSGARVVRDDRTDDTVDLVLGRRFRALNAPARTGPPKAGSPSPSC
jgi:hypothetical protein